MSKDKKKVVVALSGGVDSSVAAALLKKSGYKVMGTHLICYDEDVPYCTAKKDREDAIRVAKILNIPLKIYDFRDGYKKLVIDYFIREYKANRTPNPDVMCNKKIKFGLLLDKVLSELKAAFLATGHYARITKDFRLLKGVDPNKDQSYFLYTLTLNQLKHILFPIGGLLKPEVRKLAKKFGLPTAEKKASQGICFMGKVDVREFLKVRIKSIPGPVIDLRGKVIGEHRGLPFYTVGQRHGFTITRYMGEPLYAIDKDMKANALVVGPKDKLKVKKFKVSDAHWITSERYQDNCAVRIRHLGELLGCEMRCRKGDVGDRKLEVGRGICEVRLDKSAWGVASGQSAVFYKGEEVLGGGIIESPGTKIGNGRH